MPLYSPSILQAEKRRRLVIYYARGAQEGEQGRGFPSDPDFGSTIAVKTWTKRAESPALQGVFFEAGGALTLFVHRSRAAQSPVPTTKGSHSERSRRPCHGVQTKTWQQTAARRMFEYAERQCVPRDGTEGRKDGCLGRRGKGPVLLRAKLGDDLTRAESWTFASTLPFADIIPGFARKRAADRLVWHSLLSADLSHPKQDQPRALVFPDGLGGGQRRADP